MKNNYKKDPIEIMLMTGWSTMPIDKVKGEEE